MLLSTLFDDCLSLARIAHEGQFDKQGAPYIFHVVRVGFSLLPNMHAAAVGLLHDIPEDYSDEAAGRAFDILGPIHGDLCPALRLLTRKKSIPYSDYITAICDSQNQIALMVKLADLRDNLAPGRIQSLEAFVGPAAVRDYVIRYSVAQERINKALFELTGLWS